MFSTGCNTLWLFGIKLAVFLAYQLAGVLSEPKSEMKTKAPVEFPGQVKGCAVFELEGPPTMSASHAKATPLVFSAT